MCVNINSTCTTPCRRHYTQWCLRETKTHMENQCHTFWSMSNATQNIFQLIQLMWSVYTKRFRPAVDFEHLSGRLLGYSVSEKNKKYFVGSSIQVCIVYMYYIKQANWLSFAEGRGPSARKPNPTVEYLRFHFVARTLFRYLLRSFYYDFIKCLFIIMQQITD